jgi:glycosidase
MRTLILCTISCLIGCLGYGQIQNVDAISAPSTITVDTPVTITFSNVDPSLWNPNAPDNIFLWAWYFDGSGAVGGNALTNGSWTNSNENNRLTNNGDGTYSFTFTPSAFYGTSNISRLGMLVKAKDGSDAGLGEKKSNDIFFDIAINTLTLNNPTANLTIVNAGTSIQIEATTTFESDFTLKANGTTVNTSTAATNYSFNYTIAENTNFTLEASDGSTMLSKSFNVRLPALNPVPDGLLDGINSDPNDPTKVTLVLFAPGKNTVHVIGDFNNWTQDANYLMFHDTARDRFWLELKGLTPQTNHMYQYLVDGSIRIADPYSPSILAESNDKFIDAVTYPNLPSYPSGQTNHAVTLLKTGETPFVWEVTNFEKPQKTDLVIYELLIRDFDELHSFDAVKARLDYLENMGINAIEFMPLNEFDGNLSWGYNPSFHMGLDKYYGTANSFKQLVDECHKRGIAVIVDVVYNHASGQHPYYRMWNTDNGDYQGQAREDNPFFNSTAKHAFNVFNDFNHQSPATQDYVKRTVDYWINEYNIDGFRWDLTKGFTQNCSANDEGCTNGLQQDRVDVLKTYADYQWALDPNFYVIFEHLGIIAEEKQWADYRADEGKGILLWNTVHSAYNGIIEGNQDLANVSYINKGFDGPNAISYMESHDEERLLFSANNLDNALERLELAGAFFFTVPGPKMIWQFGELGYDISIDFNGRTGEKPIRWDYFEAPKRRAVYETWSKLIRLKQNAAIFKTTNFNLQLANPIKSIHLTSSTTSETDIANITIIGNFDTTAQAINPEFQNTGVWYDLLNNNSPVTVSDTNQNITLAPGEFRIYGDQPFIDVNDTDSDGVPNANDSCNTTPLGATVDSNGCEIFTLPSANFALQVRDETCRNSNNGGLTISAASALEYTINILGGTTTIEERFNTDFTISNLEAGPYTVCITLDTEPDYEQCYTIEIKQPEPLTVTSKTLQRGSQLSLQMKGSDTYHVTHNGVTTTTMQTNTVIELQKGQNTISVKGLTDCQGSFEKNIFLGNNINIYPNPVDDVLQINLGTSSSQTTVEIYSLLGKRLYTQTTALNRLIIDTSNFAKGTYILNVNSATDHQNLKIIKQ